MNVCEGVCLCISINWIKPETRIAAHLANFGEGEICPECNAFIEWDCSKVIE